jgi:hypothetical protein
LTTVLGSPLGAAAALVLPVGGYVDLAALGSNVLLHLARRPAASEKGTASSAETTLLHIAGIDLNSPASRPRDARRRRARREETQRRVGAAVLGRYLAEHCGHTQAQAAENVSLITGVKVTARQLGDWDRRLLRGAEAYLGVSLSGRFDQGREHSLHDARGCLDDVASAIRKAAKSTPVEQARLRVRLSRAEANYQRVRNVHYPEYTRPHGERTPDEHDAVADAVASELAQLARARQAPPPTKRYVCPVCGGPHLRADHPTATDDP